MKNSNHLIKIWYNKNNCKKQQLFREELHDNKASIFPHLAVISHNRNIYILSFSQKGETLEKTCCTFPFGKNARMDDHDDLKNRIRQFLKDMEMSREIFAQLCGVSKKQVDKWFSYLPIPETRRHVIERIMREEYQRRRQSEQDPDMDIIEILVPRNRYDHVRKTADMHGMTVQEWASRTLLALSSVPHHNL